LNAELGNISAGREKALQRCQELIDWYEKQKPKHRIFDYALQTLTIVMAGITPLLIMIDNLHAAYKALPAVIATITAGLNAAFRSRATYVNFSYAAEQLKAAKLKYEIRMAAEPSGSIDQMKDLEAFVDRIENIALTELSEWREQRLKEDTAASMRETIERLVANAPHAKHN
jgi:hypothetical protein